MSLWSVTRAQFWSSLFLQTNMERSYGGRDMLRDFTIQPAAGGSPAGKAYTHQFPEHVFLYLGIVFIEHVLFFHHEAQRWFLIGPFYDDIITITSLVWFHKTQRQWSCTESSNPWRKAVHIYSCCSRRHVIQEMHTIHSLTGFVITQLLRKTLASELLHCPPRASVS